MATILIVEDEPPLIQALDRSLRAQHHDVHTAADGTTALSLACSRRHDLVIVDLASPNGTEVIHGLRGWSRIPIIALSAHHDEGDTVAVLDAGADDYLTKPFGLNELSARIRAVLRRAEPEPADPDPVIRTSAFTVDLAAGHVTRHTPEDDQRVQLTPTEWQILQILVRNPEKLITHQQLLHEIQRSTHATSTNYLRVYLRQLRSKLEPDPARPRHLITERGIGYRFAP
ncbi:response regulator [Actinoallomurus acanthiterrae]